MKEKLKHLLVVTAGALCLMLDAFYNGFPIVYSDTSTYIASGMELETPIDRPITYGLFLRVCSFNGFSLWLVVFFQALLLSYLIYQTVKLVVGKKSFYTLGFSIIVFLSIFTGVSWTASQIMPDIFTSIAMLLLVLILFGKFNLSKTIALYLLFFVAIAMHMSHLLLFSSILLLFFLLRNYLVPLPMYLNRNTKIGVMFVLVLASVLTMGSAMSKSKHVFFMGGMVEKGILKKYLDENCATHNYQLCAYKDSLPTNFTDFVWEEDSPLYKMGWKESKAEFNEIIYATLTQPKYIGMHIKESVKATFKQLYCFDIADGNGRFMEGTLLHERVATYFKRDLSMYEHSKQSAAQLLFFPITNLVYRIVAVLSLLLLVFLCFSFKPNLKGVFTSLLFLVAITVFLNAWNCGTFSMVTDRFSCKVMWLFAFLAALGSFKCYRKE